MEIPSPFAGRIARLHAANGETLKVGAPLVTFEIEGGDGVAASVSGPAPPRTTPAVRKLAKDLGVDLSGLGGTGPEGRITARDVEVAAGSPRPFAVPSVDVGTPYEAIAVGAIRKAIAENLTRSVRDIPHVTTFRTVDCSMLEAFRGELEAGPLPIVVRALADVCVAHPMLNASYEAGAEEIRVFGRCDVGIATDTDRGLVVTVVRDAGDRGIADIAAETRRLAAAARDGMLRPGDATGATITVSNTGSYGSESGTPIIPLGQGAVLALGAIKPRALVVEAEVVARPACTLSLSFDHRLMDGATAGRALTDLVDLLESRERLEALPR